jgi:hypothetical protein
VVEMFEARGVVAEAPGRELVRPAIPADLYDKYLDPRRDRARAGDAERVRERVHRGAHLVRISRDDHEGGGDSPSPRPSPPLPRRVTYAFDDAEDAAVAAAAAAVAAALGDDDDDEDEDASGAVDSQSELVSASGADAVEEVQSTPRRRAPSTSRRAARRPAFDAPAPARGRLERGEGNGEPRGGVRDGSERGDRDEGGALSLGVVARRGVTS